MKRELVDALHQPEHTGENRCEACTVVNLVIAGVLGSLVARKSKLAGSIAVGISLVLIYLRGYLVPGTPTLTKRYLPSHVLAAFGKEPEPTIASGLGATESPAPGNAVASDSSTDGTHAVAGSGRELTFDDDGTEDDAPTSDGTADHVSADDGAGSDALDDEDERTDVTPQQFSSPEAYLLEHDVVGPCDDVDDLCLTDAFGTAWFDEIDAIDADTLDAADAANAFGFDGVGGPDDDTEDDDSFAIERFDDARVLTRDGRTVGKWPSQAALVADVTAATVLEDRDPEWESYPPESKGKLLNSLRLFLETCPTSGGDVVMGEETVESCCRSHDVVAVTCEDTGERLFEHPVEDIEA